MRSLHPSAKTASFRLRPVQPEDLEQLSRIDERCFPPGIAYNRAELSHYIRRAGSLTLVAELIELGGASRAGTPASSSSASVSASVPVSSSPASMQPDIAGFIVAQKLRRAIGHVITIDVLPAARRSGLGSQLMAEVERQLRAAACTAVYLEVAVDNLAAISFYHRHGYSILKTIPRYYQGELDALLMMKRLE